MESFDSMLLQNIERVIRLTLRYQSSFNKKKRKFYGPMTYKYLGVFQSQGKRLEKRLLHGLF